MDRDLNLVAGSGGFLLRAMWEEKLIMLYYQPFQVVQPLGWLAIPGVALAAFVYCGLMKCAEGIVL